MNKICLWCGKEFISRKERKYCGRICFYNAPSKLIGIPIKEETKKKISDSLRGRHCSPRTEFKKGHSSTPFGINHPRWTGNTPENNLLRGRAKYKKWRLNVFRRDDWTCQKCGVRGVKLRPHHIRNFAENKRLRTVLSNGITLCEPCHKEFHHIFGNKKNNRNQIKKYVNKKISTQTRNNF